jgi:hypothetical protein
MPDVGFSLRGDLGARLARLPHAGSSRHLSQVETPLGIKYCIVGTRTSWTVPGDPATSNIDIVGMVKRV